MHENDDKTKDTPLDLKDLIFFTLYKWRKMIFTAIIMALIFGGYKSATILHNNGLTNSNYQSLLIDYNQNREKLVNEIDNLTRSIEELKYYNENSILMNINPLNKQAANITFYVSVDKSYEQDVNNNYSQRIINSYVALAENGDMYHYIIDRLTNKIEYRYLKECVSATADYSNHMLTINIAHYNKEICEEIYQIVKDYFEQKQDIINRTVGQHSKSIVNSSIQSEVDLDLDNMHNINDQLLSDYQAKLVDKQNALKLLVAPLKISFSFSTVIKYAALGFFLGIIISIVLLIFSYMMSARLINLKDFNDRFNIRLLGNIKRSKKEKVFYKIDHWLNTIEGVSITDINNDEEIRIICANLKVIFMNMDNVKIMLTGTVDKDTINNIFLMLKDEITDHRIELIPAGNITYSASTIYELQNCDSVVLIEEVNRSSYTEISKQIGKINDFNKNIIGAILI